jgi:hypothetical protein
MEKDKTINEISLSSVLLRTAWLLADAAIFGLAMYKTIEYALLYMDGVTGTLSLVVALAAAATAIIALRITRVRWFKECFVPAQKVFDNLPRHPIKIKCMQIVQANAELFFIGGIALLMMRLSLIQGNSQSFTWIPLEWHKYPLTFKLLVKTSPVFAIFIATMVVAGAFLIEKRNRWITMPITTVAIYIALKQCSIISKEESFILYFFIYILPLFGLFAALAARRKILAMRLLAYCAIPFILMWHYFGWMPYISERSFTRSPGVEKLYPRMGNKSEFPLAFLRDFKLDPSERNLFTAYGPTSGIIKLDLRLKKIYLLDTPKDMVRYIQFSSEPGRFYALDWSKYDLLTITSEPLRIVRRENAYFRNGLYVPFYFLLKNDKIYATYTEQPGLAEFELNPLKLHRKILFRELGLTKFRSGVMLAAIDPLRDRIFVEIGMTDQRDKFVVARIDLKTFRMDGKAEMPEGGLELLSIPGHRRVLATSFYSDRIYEFDMDTMKRTRILRGPVSCRNLVYDKHHNMLIGTGFLKGELRFIDYGTGRTLKTARIGNKASSLAIGADGRRIYLGSSWGIFRVDIARFLGASLR